MNVKKVILKKGREYSVKNRHPWIFSGALLKADKELSSGEFVQVISYMGEPLGLGWYSSHSQIAVRMLYFGEEDIKEQDIIFERIKNALYVRAAHLNLISSNAFRIINSEGDMLPGVIVDKYDEYLVCQFLCAGSDKSGQEIVNILKELVPCKGIYERSDSDVREKEGLKPIKRKLYGDIPDCIEIYEKDAKFLIDIKDGHKTGFYLDQRENRYFIRDIANDKSILNCFSYTGGFGVHAIKGGCREVINVDKSSYALDILNRNMKLNGIIDGFFSNLRDNVFTLLKNYKDEKRFFDIVILDPPKFVKGLSHLNKGLTGYKKINTRALNIVKEGGYLVTFSCSAHVDMETFKKIISEALILSNREGIIIKELSQSLDHPYLPSFPQGRYLKGLVLKVY